MGADPEALWGLAREILKNEPLAGKRVVDFGCGDGAMGVWMAGEGAEVYLLDFSRKAVDEALERAKSSGLERRVRGILVQGSKLDMFADRGFDLVLTRGLPGPEMLAELARAMKPDARLVVAAAEDVDTAGLAGWFGAVQTLHARSRSRWYAGLGSKQKRGEAVITARRAL